MARWGDRWVPNNLPMNLAKVMGVTLMRLEASIDYPNRLETGRLVMFYDRLEDPRGMLKPWIGTSPQWNRCSADS